MPFYRRSVFQIAEGYENAAADPLVAGEKRVDLVKKAEWFRFVAQRERAHEPGNERGFTALTRPEAEPPSQGRSWRSMTPFLTTLWITGAAVYLLSTVLFTNAVNLFGPEEPKTPVPEIRQSVVSVPKAANVEADNMAEQAHAHPGRPERRHAISPDQPTYKSPTLTAALPPLPQEELTSQDSAQNLQPKMQHLPLHRRGRSTSAPLEPSEMLTVTSAATIRNGPFTAAKKIGTATAGAELQVKGREKDWVHFVDPSSGNTGWNQSSLLAPAAGAAGIAFRLNPQNQLP